MKERIKLFLTLGGIVAALFLAVEFIRLFLWLGYAMGVAM